MTHPENLASLQSPVSKEHTKGTDRSRSLSASGSVDTQHDGEAQQPTPTRVLSKTTSVISRSKRRGLLGRFTIVAEIEEPHDYDRRVKWFITFVIATAAAAAPMGSAIFFRKPTDSI